MLLSEVLFFETKDEQTEVTVSFIQSLYTSVSWLDLWNYGSIFFFFLFLIELKAYFEQV